MIKKYAFALTKEEQAITFKRRLKPRQQLLLFLSFTVGPACSAVGFIVGEFTTALLITAGALIFLVATIRLYMGVKNTQLMVKNSGNISWSIMKGFKTSSGSRNIEDIPKDATGHRFKIKKYIHNMPGARTIAGIPVYISINAVKEDGRGYETIFSVETVTSHANDIIQLILEHLPDSYIDES